MQRHKTIPSALSLALLLLLIPGAQAQEAPPEPSGFLAEYMALEDRVSDRMIGLAKAIPAEKYSWRPAEGVRSISEALMHIAGTNFGAAQSVGAPLPPGLPEDLGKVTDKDRVIELLETSFKVVRGVSRGMAGADLSQPLPNSGGMTMRSAILNHAEHHGEHLGQLIAYARSVGVVPPWSR